MEQVPAVPTIPASSALFWSMTIIMANLRITSELIKGLPSPGIPPLAAPYYAPPSSQVGPGTMFAVASMKDHMTDEGWQIALALRHAGYNIYGSGVVGSHPHSGLTDVKEILKESGAGILVIQDKREWDLAPKDFRDPNARLINYLSLKNRHDVFKLTILKDAHQRPGYHAQSAEEMGVHAWITYYHPSVVCRVAPYVRREHLVRTYHSTDKNLYTWLLPEGDPQRADPRERASKTLLSGAISPAYPLRMYLRDMAERLPGMRVHRHPGYHRNGCATPDFIKLLQKFKVAVCTSSIYGYALRKIIEATAAGCMVITDLPSDEILPGIDANLIRVPSDVDWHEVYRIINRCYREYDLEKQIGLAQQCLEWYDYHPIGERLAWDIEMMRRNYPLAKSSATTLPKSEWIGRPIEVTPTEEWHGIPVVREDKPPMTEDQALAKMVAPGAKRPGKWRGGVIQIWVTRACDKSCFSCTQGSNLGGKPEFITPEQFEQACISLKGYFGVVGMFGGNPATHPKFIELCEIMRRHIPFEQRGLWCNNLITSEKGTAARETFNPRHSNLNVHLDKEAYTNFKRWWPESMPFGLDKDSRHSPPFVAMKDVLRKKCPTCADGSSIDGAIMTPGGTTLIKNDKGGLSRCPTCDGKGQVYDESRAWELISDCDINKHWSAMIGVFRGHLRAWFCEIAGAQAMLHQWDRTPMVEEVVQLDKEGHGTLIQKGKVSEYTYPDTGFPIIGVKEMYPSVCEWWQLPMNSFKEQVRKHCHECGVPLRGYGQLAQSQEAVEQVSETHSGIYVPKTRGRQVERVTELVQLGQDRITRVTDYLQNSEK